MWKWLIGGVPGQLAAAMLVALVLVAALGACSRGDAMPAAAPVPATSMVAVAGAATLPRAPATSDGSTFSNPTKIASPFFPVSSLALAIALGTEGGDARTWTQPGDTGTPGKLPVSARSSTVRFAVIGDYGAHNKAELEVANLVKSWNPDFIITTGDNNYPDGAPETIDKNIGQFYGEYIYPYYGQSVGSGQIPANRFFPTLGNHDWRAQDAQPYLDYFALPGNERYYAFSQGPVDFFALDSDAHEPDGITQNSVQGTWLRKKLAASTAPWKIVYMHHPPFSSGRHGSSPALQWPYKNWGATAVIAGHDHLYERMLIDGFPYFVNGLGGAHSYPFRKAVPGSQVKYREDQGAMLVDASGDRIVFRFYTSAGRLIDKYTLTTDLN